MFLVLAAAIGTVRHLVVLQHGLYGSRTNLAVLEDACRRIGGKDVMVLSASCNEGRTRDGVARGGIRLAAEIRSVAALHPSLRSLSCVGNSLGGLYVRYAVAELCDADGLMAGMTPEACVTIGCPHLGVRRYTFLPLPNSLASAGRLVAGQTADDLLLRDVGGEDGQPVLMTMASAGSPYIRALRAFRQRRAYANVRGDFMVPFGTAAFEDPDVWGAGCFDASRVAEFARRGSGQISFADPAVLDGSADGIGAIRDVPGRTDENMVAPTHNDGREGREEARMRRELESCGWTKVGVSFRTAGTFSPVAHNRLAALRRAGWRRVFAWIERAHEGRPVMEHCAQFLVGGD